MEKPKALKIIIFLLTFSFFLGVIFSQIAYAQWFPLKEPKSCPSCNNIRLNKSDSSPQVTASTNPAPSKPSGVQVRSESPSNPLKANQTNTVITVRSGKSQVPHAKITEEALVLDNDAQFYWKRGEGKTDWIRKPTASPEMPSDNVKARLIEVYPEGTKLGEVRGARKADGSLAGEYQLTSKNGRMYFEQNYTAAGNKISEWESAEVERAVNPLTGPAAKVLSGKINGLLNYNNLKPARALSGSTGEVSNRLLGRLRGIIEKQGIQDRLRPFLEMLKRKSSAE